MTDEQMRIAIAKACGWKHVEAGGVQVNGALQTWEAHWTQPGTQWKLVDGSIVGIPEEVPDYINDLNAMHEAEKTFVDDDVIAERYWLALYDATEHTRWPYYATARQRAEAFLKTLNLWKD